MRKGDAQIAKPFDSRGRIALLGKLEEFAATHVGENYTIATEGEARQLLLALSLVMKENAVTLSKPLIPVPGFNAKKYNKAQVVMVRKMANKFKRAASNGMALQFCIDELSYPVLEFKRVGIIFGKIQ